MSDGATVLLGIFLYMPWAGPVIALALAAFGRPVIALFTALGLPAIGYSALFIMLMQQITTEQDVGAAFVLGVSQAWAWMALAIGVALVAIVSLIRYILTQRRAAR